MVCGLVFLASNRLLGHSSVCSAGFWHITPKKLKLLGLFSGHVTHLICLAQAIDFYTCITNYFQLEQSFASIKTSMDQLEMSCQHFYMLSGQLLRALSAGCVRGLTLT